MRKSIFLMVVLSLCAADFGAFAGVARERPGTTNVPSTNTSTSAGAVARERPGTPKVSLSNNAAPVDTARAGKRQATKVAKVAAATTATTAAANAAAATTVARMRAGATQKVVSNGTKVSAATTNTVVPQECQDAYYGCMDSFCMIDNESGGRCQCSDRNAELKTVMDEIAQLDEQSYIMATEGVKRIQMGENADAIIAAAKAAGDKATGKATDTTIGTRVKAGKAATKTYQLDLSAWNNSIYSEDESDDLFSSISVSVDGDAVNNALAKKGNALYTDSAQMCLSQMPTQCKSHLKILQNMYAQKIRSDCTAFENKLKQDKVASSQKLRAAEQALRDAALTDFENKNRYGLGGCVQEYARCMKSECGDDYTKCITLSAEENMKGGAGDRNARTIKGVVDIVLSGSTMTQLLSKKTICDDEVLGYCENVRDQVWDEYIIGAATELKAAELAAEDDMRQNCIKSTAECFKNSCAASWDPKKDAVNYDICLADPMIVYDSCKIKIEACLVATGSTNTKTKEGLKKSRLWEGVVSMLAALRVDACTEELKAEIENACGKDFTNCVGLSTEGVVALVAEAKLTACQDRYNSDAQGVLDYAKSIAQGYMLQIESSVASGCQKAVESAMATVCGATDSCQTATLSKQSVAKLLKAQICDKSDRCYDNIESFGLSVKDLGLTAKITSRPKMSTGITYNYDVTGSGDFFGAAVTDSETVEAVGMLNNAVKMKMAVIENDPKVAKCLATTKDDGSTQPKFPNLTQNAKIAIADSVLSNFLDVYDEELTALAKDKIPSFTKQIKEKLTAELEEEKAKAEALEAANDAAAEKMCKTYESMSQGEPSVHGCVKEYTTYSAVYDPDANKCAVVRRTFHRWNCNCGILCPFNKESPTEVSKSFSSEELINGTAKF